jgi:hypothetical protein
VGDLKDVVESLKEVFHKTFHENLLVVAGLSRETNTKITEMAIGLRDVERKSDTIIEATGDTKRYCDDLGKEIEMMRTQFLNVPGWANLVKRLKAIETTLETIKEEGSGDPEAGKKLRSVTREKDSLEEEKEELAQQLRHAKKAFDKMTTENQKKDEAYKSLQKEFKAYQDQKRLQHERRAEAAVKAWEKRRGIVKVPEKEPEQIDDSDEDKDKDKDEDKDNVEDKYSNKKEKPSKLTFTSNGSVWPSHSGPFASTSSDAPRRSKQNPGGPPTPVPLPMSETGFGLGITIKPKAPIKKRTLESSDESSGEEFTGGDEVREAWTKKKKSKTDSDSE